MSPRTIVIGDTHGCLDELDELLLTVAFRKGLDRLVFVGDFMDRGPDPAGVVRRVRELGGESVLGNHEEKHLRWRRHVQRARADPTYCNPMRPFDEKRLRENAALREEDWEWLELLPHQIALDSRWIVVHGGFLPGVPAGAQDPRRTLRLRYVDERDCMLQLDSDRNVPGNGTFWAARWTGPESVIYGHNVSSLASPRMDEPSTGVLCCGIDTGCVFGGRLTAIVLEAHDAGVLSVTGTCQVQSRREYVPLRGGPPE